MTGEYYFDTSIWIDFHEKRGKNGESALKLITKIVEDKGEIFYSDLRIKEFKRFGYTNNDINAIFSIVKPSHLRHVHSYREEIDESKKIAKTKNIPAGDVLHAILARDNQLQLVSRDRDFDKLRDVTIVKKPEELI